MTDAAVGLLARIRGGKAITNHPISRGLHGASDYGKPVIFLADEWPGQPEHQQITEISIAQLKAMGFLSGGFDGHVVRVDAGDHYEAWWVLDQSHAYAPV